MERLGDGFGAWLVVGTAADRIATAASQKPERLTIKKEEEWRKKKYLPSTHWVKAGKISANKSTRL
jgi:hypothetical protein